MRAGGRKGRPYRSILARLAGALASAALLQSVALGQVETRDPTIANLPRPGYEPRTIIIGRTVIAPTIEIDGQYDNNIFATPNDRVGDAIFDLRPSVLMTRATPGFDLKGKLTADVRRYARNSREDVTAFGAEVDGRKLIGKTQTISARLSFDRLFERRSDPEATTDRARHPALINAAEASIDYAFQGPRLGIAASAQIENLNYLPLADADRDLTSYRGSLRASLKVTPRIAAYIESYANRRDARLPVDRSGLDRDTTTLGVLAGVSFDIAQRLQGNMGAGVFHANPDDRTLKSYNGLALSGRLTYRPRIRTAISFDAFRGDVATIRAGALGRIDTRLALGVDQEARHNLLLHGAVSFRDITYRGPARRNQRYYGVEAEARYLLNRRLSLSLGGNYTRRGADLPDERFRRWQTMLGVRISY